MTEEHQKEFERAILQGFLRRASIPGVPKEGDFEAPDAVITIGCKEVGVEITEIQKSTDERRIRSLKEDLLRRTRRCYESAGGRPICTMISFRNNVAISESKREREALAEKIAQILIAGSLRLVGSVSVVAETQLAAPLGNRLREIRFWGADGDCIWQISEANSVAPLTIEVLQERIEAKAQRLPSYRLKGYAESWLLICADPRNPACRFDPPVAFDPKKVTSPFDRTFFYDAWHLIELGQKI